MNHSYFDGDWESARASLRGLSEVERGVLLQGIHLEEYERRSQRMPTAHRPRFTEDHPLLGAPHAMSLALQLLRDDGQLDAIRWLALDSDSGDHRSWKYKHQATVTSLDPLAGLTGLGMLVADLNQAPDLSPLRGCTGLTHLYLRSYKRRPVTTRPTLDLSPLAGLANLEMISLGDTVRSADLGPLAGLERLRILVLDDASLIRDLGPLSELERVVRLQLMKALRLSDLRPIASLLEGIANQNDRCIDGSIPGDQVEAMVAAWSLSLDDAGAERLCALRRAIRAGDPEALEAALPGADPAILDLLLASVESSASGFSAAGWSDIKRAGGRTTDLILRLARARGRLADWEVIALAPQAPVDHALLDSAAGLERLILPAGVEVSGPTLAAWMALPARLRTALQNLDPAAYAEGLALLEALDPPADLRALLLSRLPDLVCATDATYALPNMDLRGLALAGATITAALPGADLRGLDLTGAHFDGVDLRGARLQGAALTRARFTRCHLDGADLTGATWAAALRDTRTAWPDGPEGPLVLPVSEVIEAQEALAKHARALSDTLRDLGDAIPPHVEALLQAIPTIGLHWSSGGHLQRTLDGHRLAAIERRLPLVFACGDDLVVEGQFDDETGHDLDRLTLGPVYFNSGGEFVFRRDALITAFEGLVDEDDRARFDRALREDLSGDADEWEGTPAERLFSAPEALDEAAMIAALTHICEAREDLGDECVGQSEQLEAFFGLIDRIYRRCAPMQKENETLPMRWVKARLF